MFDWRIDWRNEKISYKDQGPSWEANSSSASHEFPHILCKQKVHLHLSWAIILLVVPLQYYPPIYACVFTVVSFPQFSSPKPRMDSFSHTRAIYPAHLNILVLNTNILWRGKIKKLLIMQSPPLPSNPVPPRLRYPPQHPALKLPVYLTTFVSATLPRPEQLIVHTLQAFSSRCYRDVNDQLHAQAASRPRWQRLVTLDSTLCVLCRSWLECEEKYLCLPGTKLVLLASRSVPYGRAI